MELEIDAARRTFKDVKLFPGGAREWDWRETGTDNVPRIQPADVDELFDHGAKVIVLSKGIQGRVQVCPETLDSFTTQTDPRLRAPDRGVPT